MGHSPIRGSPQRWVAVLNPSRSRFDEVVKPLIAEAHERLAKARRTEVGRGAE